MIFSDKDLKKCLMDGNIKITPMDFDLIGPSGIDLRLGHQLKVFKDMEIDIFNPLAESEEGLTQIIEPKNGRFIIPPDELILATTMEKVELPEDIAARLIPRNSLSQLGIFLLSGSGTIEPGFKGNLTMAIINSAKVPVILYPGMPFCKLVFECMSSCAEKPYFMKGKIRKG